MCARSQQALLLIALLFGALAPVGPAQAAEAAPRQLARTHSRLPAGLLNPDGTLRLADGFSGSLDLSGWQVRLDPARGPVFGQANAPAVQGQWANLGSGGAALDDQVAVIAVTGTTVYVGGQFLDADSLGASGQGIVKWNGSTWSALDPAHHVNGKVQAIALSGSDVYIGGFFDVEDAAGVPLSSTANIAEWTGSAWLPLGGDGSGGPSLKSPVLSIVVTGTTVYAGGQFTDVDDNGVLITEADYVAEWNGALWLALAGDGSAGGSLNGQVNALALVGPNLYVGGNFTDVKNYSPTGLSAADYVARWDGVNWHALGSGGAGNGSLNGPVYALAGDASGTSVYAGGHFTNVANGPTTLAAADYLAKWNGSAWSAVGSGTGGNGSLNGNVFAIATSGAQVFVGGQFTNVDDGGSALAAADYVAEWNGAHWSALGADGLGDGAIKNGFVGTLALDGSANPYAGGSFTQLFSSGSALAAVAYIAGWNGAGWSALAGRPNGVIPSTDGQWVDAVAISGTDVYVGGFFQDLRDGTTLLKAADNIARWDGAQWHALGSNGANNGAVGGLVRAIVVMGPDVYVGGSFANVSDNGTPLPAADDVARWDGSHWHALGSDGSGGGALNGTVAALAVAASGQLYVGGSFSDVTDAGIDLPAAAHVARWNGSHWFALGSDGAGGPAVTGDVDALAVSGPDVYVGGNFFDVNNNGTPLGAADHVARWSADTGAWSALGSDGAGNGALNNTVTALAASGASVYVGGLFTDVNDNGTPLPAADYVARWDANTGAWSALGSNGAGNGALNQPVDALLLAGSDLYVGGKFTNVNDNGTPLGAADHVARWDGGSWSALGSNGAGNGSLNSEVAALAVDGSRLYAGGFFTDANNNGAVLPAADRIAEFGLTLRLYLPLVHR